MFKATKRSLIVTALVGMTLLSNPLKSQEIGDQLDAMIATGAFNYEPYANVTLSQVGRHAFSLPRMRFNVPTSSINLIQWSPPSIDTSCSSVSLNLGNFSFISLDEAISALRSIAAQSLTYGFGQAVQALCQPCWAGMKDLQNVLQAFNKHSQNTCFWAEQAVTALAGDEGFAKAEDYMCGQIGKVFGDDKLDCKGISDNISTATQRWIGELEGIGIDTDKAFVEGNSVYESFARVIGNPANFDTAIPTVSSRLFFGDDLNAAEVAMTFLGTEIAGKINDADEGKGGPRFPLIKNYMDLLTVDHNLCEPGDPHPKCLQFYQCNDAVTSANGFECMQVNTVPVRLNLIGDVDCPQLVTNETLENYLNCHVDDLITKMERGNMGVGGANLSTVQLMLLAHLTFAEQSVFYIGTEPHKEALTEIVREHFTKFLATSVLHDYLVTVRDSSLSILNQAQKIENMEEHLIGAYSNLTLMQEQISQIAEQRNEQMEGLRDNETWASIVEKYSTSTAAMVAEINSARM